MLVCASTHTPTGHAYCREPAVAVPSRLGDVPRGADAGVPLSLDVAGADCGVAPASSSCGIRITFGSAASALGKASQAAYQ